MVDRTTNEISLTVYAVVTASRYLLTSLDSVPSINSYSVPHPLNPLNILRTRSQANWPENMKGFCT